MEGARVWALVRRLGGQVRRHDRNVVGWDMTAAMSMARAMGIARAAVHLLPIAEAAMVRKINEQQTE